MKKWVVKALVQGGLSVLPGSHRWNHLIQQRVTRSLQLTDAYFERKVQQGFTHLAHYHRVASKRPGSSLAALEFGTGWHPIVPICLMLGGASPVWTVDRTALLEAEHVREMLQHFGPLLDRAPSDPLFQGLLHRERAELLASVIREAGGLSVAEILRRLEIRPVVGDLRSCEIPVVHLCVSNNTLEHIPEEELQGIFARFARLMDAAGVMSHHVDLRDHYAGFDAGISPYNFYRFSPFVWRFFNNGLHFQNRLRFSDYAALHRQSGFRLVHTRVEEGDAERLARVPLARCFRHYSLQDLQIIDAWFVSVPDTNGPAVSQP